MREGSRLIMSPARKSLLTIAHAALLCLLSFSALADRVSWRSHFKPTTLHAASLTCHQDAFQLSCKLGDKTLFDVHAFADHLAVSDKGQYIVGLSNRGGVPLFWLRNFDGEEIALMPVSKIGFCEKSVSNVRRWFDDKGPEVTFQFNDDRLTKVIVKGCDGQEVVFLPSEGGRGIWQQIFETAAGSSEPPEQAALDSTHVKAHRCALGGRGGPRNRRSVSPKVAGTARFMGLPTSCAARGS
jgi:hypothetical protein